MALYGDMNLWYNRRKVALTKQDYVQNASMEITVLKLALILVISGKNNCK